MKIKPNLYLFVFLSFAMFMASCKRRIPRSNSAPPIVNNCYIDLRDAGGFNLCGKDFFSNSNLNIEVSILVEDLNNPGNTNLWAVNGIVNPIVVPKSALIPAPNSIGMPNSSILSPLPGNQNYMIKARAIGDCCNFCPQCPDGFGGFYYGRLLYSGKTEFRIIKEVIPGYDYLVPIFLKIDPSEKCEADSECR